MVREVVDVMTRHATPAAVRDPGCTAHHSLLADSFSVKLSTRESRVAAVVRSAETARGERTHFGDAAEIAIDMNDAQAMKTWTASSGGHMAG
jgi:hypothetical protein